jgi:hypothetical protein
MFTLALTLVLAGQWPEPPTLTGKLLDPDGRPAPGVELVLAEVWLPPGGPAGLNVFRSYNSPPVVLARSRSDGAGRFQIPSIVRRTDAAARYRPRVLWAHRPGTSAALRVIPLHWPADAEPVELRLGRASPTSLRVVDPRSSSE